MFNKLVASFASLTILLWVLPLGILIKPSQEKTACDAQRAFHMCSMMNPANELGDSKVKFTNSGNKTEKAKDSSSMGTQTLLQNVFKFFPPFGFDPFESAAALHASSLNKAIDHPPRTHLFF